MASWSVVELTELLAVGVLVVEKSPNFSVSGLGSSGSPGPPRPLEGPGWGGNGGIGGMGGIRGPPGPLLGLESNDCAEED